MAHSQDETSVAQPEVFTLHWEGPGRAVEPPEHRFPDSSHEREAELAALRERELAELRRSEQGRALWEQISEAAAGKGDVQLWKRKLHAYWWVKLQSAGNAGDYARRFDANHATVRTWIADVAKLAYEVGYRLAEDKLLLVGRAPRGLQRLREEVNRDAASREAWDALCAAEGEFRGEDPYFHLNEGHVLRARGRLRQSDDTLKEGLTIAEARRVRSLLWNARGQTFWDCRPGASWVLSDHLGRAEKAFRRAVILDQSTYFPFVNLAQLAVDARDFRRAEYWIGELATARKGMRADMSAALAKYLVEAEWTRPVEQKRYWRNGPRKWIAEAAKKGVLAVAAALLLLTAAAPPSSALPGGDAPAPIETAERPANSGAGGN